ncbi:hypothetical protein GCM10027289_03800 [Tsukamurella serpentis]
MPTVSNASRIAARIHTAAAVVRRPGICIGRLTAAFATMPVPMTQANQFGVRLETASCGVRRSRSSRFRAGPGETEPVDLVCMVNTVSRAESFGNPQGGYLPIR